MRVMIAGKRHRGKDTMADIIQEFRPEVIRATFANSLKQDLARMTKHWLSPMNTQDEAKINQVLRNRDVMGSGWQWWGEFERTLMPDHWIRQFDLNYGHIDNLVVSDLRHHNEAEYGRQNGFLLVRVDGPYRGSDLDNRSDLHPSEIHVAELPVDLEYYNRGTLDDMREFVARTVIPAADRLYGARSAV